MSTMTVPEQPVQMKAPQWWRIAVPLAIIAVIAALPPPHGLEQHTWYYFAIFSGVIAGSVLEPLPNPAETRDHLSGKKLSPAVLNVELERLRVVWRQVQHTRQRDAVYEFLEAAYGLVSRFNRVGGGGKLLRKLHRLDHQLTRIQEPYAAVRLLLRSIPPQTFAPLRRGFFLICCTVQ